MKLHGKIVGKSVKDAGKGKDAGPSEAGLIEVRLDGINGVRGKVQLPIDPEKLGQFDLGDLCAVDLQVTQTRLALQTAANG